MVRLGIFVCFVSALYVIGQKEQAARIHPQPAGVPMTLTLDGTRISGPERSGAEWKSDIAVRDIAAAPVGFGPDTTTFIDPIRIAAPTSGN